jgi:hypothetical protein
MNLFFCSFPADIYGFFTSETYPEATYAPIPAVINDVPDYTACTNKKEHATVKARHAILPLSRGLSQVMRSCSHPKIPRTATFLDFVHAKNSRTGKGSCEHKLFMNGINEFDNCSNKGRVIEHLAVVHLFAKKHIVTNEVIGV